MSEQPSITCPNCHRTSYNRHDAAQRYCGYCHKFHSDMKAPPTERPGFYYETPGALCPSCAHPFDIAVTASGKPPERGTLSVCMKCGDAAIYVSSIEVAPLPAEVILALKFEMPLLYARLIAMQEQVRHSS
jgi:hypothetical protein